jgi:site-specific DNA recombinase
MAERPAERPAVCLEFAFDRLLPIKLQQVYGLLVANCVRPVGQTSEENRGDGREACSDLRQGLIGQTEGRTQHCESNGSSARVRPTAGLRRAR